jgi:hypothetical protein
MQRRGARKKNATRLCNVKSSKDALATRSWPPYQPITFLKLVLKQFDFGPVETASASRRNVPLFVLFQEPAPVHFFTKRFGRNFRDGPEVIPRRLRHAVGKPVRSRALMNSNLIAI